MKPQEPVSRRTMLLLGVVMAFAGLYFMLAAVGLVPSPGKANGPAWLVFAAGLVFFLGGLGAIIQMAAGADERTGELPPDAPRWLRPVQYFVVLAITVSFAAMGSWIAIGPGTRSFTGTFPIGEVGGRIVFGIGAAIVWLFVFAMAKRTARELLGRGKT